MTLKEGSRLGSYEVVSRLGAGGMGEVYRARDTRLNRDVALKVLPGASAHDRERMARFEREAQVLASLNHPNIASIYGLEESGGMRALVMELVEGPTLADRIAQGPIPLAEALAMAQQIAEAIKSAHEKGIVHRDLKPANAMVTAEGTVKVLDFGLAKGTQPSDVTSDSSQSPTRALEGTTPGTILGTASYMSPEQARGKAADKRSDIWAFGCVLFEMLSGQKAFEGETVSDRIAAILIHEPNWEAIPQNVPDKIRNLLRRCLEKNADRRLSDLGDAKPILDEVLGDSQSFAYHSPFSMRFGKRALIGISAMVLLLAIGTIWVVTLRNRFNSLSAVPEKKLLVVLPFKDLSGQPSGQLMGDGMVETLGARLAKIPDIQIIMPAVAIAASDKEKEPFRVAEKVGANLLMQGSVQHSGDQLRITFSVWNTQQRLQIAGDTVDGVTSDLFGMQDRLAEDVISSLRLSRAPLRLHQASGLEAAGEQEQYIKAIGSLQRYDRDTSVDEAIALLGALDRGKPDVPIVQAALGRAYLAKFHLTRDKKWVEYAVSACTRAQQLNPDFAEVDVTLGELRTASGQASEAIVAFRRALAQQPNNFGASLGLADAFNASGNLQEAEATYRRAINLQPSYWGGYSKLAGFYFLHGNYSKAGEMFSRVTELSPDNARAFANLGAAYQLMGDFDRALASYKKSLALSPTSLAYSNIGTLEFFTGHPDKAAEAYEAALRLTPEHFELWANLGDAYRWTLGLQSKAPEAYAKAISLCRGELRLNPAAGLVHSILALSLAKTGKVSEAEVHAQKALAADPNNPEFLYNAAVVANISHKKKEALAWISLASKGGYPKIFIAREPEFEDLRGDPVFKEAVQNQK